MKTLTIKPTTLAGLSMLVISLSTAGCGPKKATKRAEKAVDTFGGLAPAPAERDELPAFSNNGLSGKINGENWQPRAGFISVSLSDETPILRVELYDADLTDPCRPPDKTGYKGLTFSFGGDDEVFEARRAEGMRHTLTFLAMGPTLADLPRNVITDNFKVRIEMIDESVAKGSLVASFDDNNQVNGSFEVKNCLETADQGEPAGE